MSLTSFYYLAITAIYILMSWSIYLPYRIGQLHFMTVANMAISAYFAALMTIHFSWPFWAVLAAGTLLGALLVSLNGSWDWLREWISVNM